MLAVADTSALIPLATCDCLDLLDRLFDEVKVPSAVLAECTVPGKAQFARLASYLAPRVVEVDPRVVLVTSSGLGRGELETMALARALGADRLLIDDRRARRIAQLNGIRVIGSLGILLGAKERGFVTAIQPLIELVRGGGGHYSDEIVDRELRIAGVS